MRTTTTKPCGSRLLRPLRDVGLADKTQCWDIEDIQAAIREAYLEGVSPESLYGTASQPNPPENGIPGRVVTPVGAPTITPGSN